MSYVICDKANLRCVAAERYGALPSVDADMIAFEVDDLPPDREIVRWNSDSQTPALRPATQAELDADADAENDDKAGNLDPLLRALVRALNDGSFVPGSSYTGPQIKAIIKAKL